jgi:hypothetical protein
MTKKILIISGATTVYGKERIALAITKGLKERGYVIHTATSAWNDGKLTKLGFHIQNFFWVGTTCQKFGGAWIV